MTSTRPLILLVEDHDDSRAMYAEFLKTSYDVLEAADGQMAWEIMQQTPPVVVVTDLSLPRVDGYELIGRIRADERLRHIPVVALSGHTPKTMETPEEGWDLELLKPCLPEDLMNAIVKLASGRKTMG